MHPASVDLALVLARLHRANPASELFLPQPSSPLTHPHPDRQQSIPPERTRSLPTDRRRRGHVPNFSLPSSSYVLLRRSLAGSMHPAAGTFDPRRIWAEGCGCFGWPLQIPTIDDAPARCGLVDL